MYGNNIAIYYAVKCLTSLVPLYRHQPIMLLILPNMLIIMLKLFATVPMFYYFLMDNDKLWLMNN